MSAYLWRPARLIGAYALVQMRAGVSVAKGIPLAEIAAAKRLSLDNALSGLKELICAGYAMPCWSVDERPASVLQFRPTMVFLALCQRNGGHGDAEVACQSTSDRHSAP